MSLWTCCSGHVIVTVTLLVKTLGYWDNRCLRRLLHACYIIKGNTGTCVRSYVRLKPYFGHKSNHFITMRIEFKLQCALKSNYDDSHLIRIDCVRTKRTLRKTVTLLV